MKFNFKPWFMRSNLIRKESARQCGIWEEEEGAWSRSIAKRKPQYSNSMLNSKRNCFCLFISYLVGVAVVMVVEVVVLLVVEAVVVVETSPCFSFGFGFDNLGFSVDDSTVTGSSVSESSSTSFLINHNDFYFRHLFLSFCFFRGEGEHNFF